MRFNFKTAVGGKEARQIAGERMLELARRAQLAKVAEFFFNLGIERLETDFVVSEAGDFAAGEDVDGKIYGDSAGMKKIERPKIESAAGQVNPAGRVRNDRTGRRQILFRIKLGHLAELAVTAVKELLHRLVFQLVKVLEQDFIHHGGRGVMVKVRSAVRLRDDLVDNCHFL